MRKYIRGVVWSVAVLCLAGERSQAATNDIIAGVTQAGTVGFSEFDVYRYLAAPVERVTVLVTSTGGGLSFNPVFDLLSTNGTILKADQTFTRGIVFTNAGLYQIIVRDGGADDSGDYQVTLIRTPGANLVDAGETNSIVAGQTVSGDVGWADLDVYQYVSQGNERVTISLANKGGGLSFNPVFDVLNTNGVPLVTDQSFFRSLTMTNAGVYQIVVRDADAFDSGSYDMTLIRTPGSNLADDGETNTVFAGRTVSGDIGWGDLDVYQYVSQGNERVTISLANKGGGLSFNPVFDVLDTNGAPLVTDQSFFRSLGLSNAGVYQIVVRDGDAFDSGSYDMTLIRTPGSNLADDGETNRITSGQTVSGDIGWGDLDVYTYTSAANERVTINLANTGGGLSFNPVFDVLDTSGVPLVTNQLFARDLVLSDAGLYQILVRDGDAFDSGTYEMTLVRTPGPTNNLAAGQVVDGDTGWGDLDVYGYSGVANERVTITLANKGGGLSFNPVFDLLAPDGTVLVTDQTLLRQFTLTGSGVYQILVRDGDSFDAGAYELSVIRTDGPNLVDEGETNSLSGTQTVSGNTGWADWDLYDFAAVAGDALFVSLNNAGGGLSFSPIFEIWDSDGSLLTSGTSARRYYLSKTGRYRIAVHDSDFFDSGAYSLTFSQIPGPPPPGSAPQYVQAFTSSNNSVVVRWSTNAAGFRLQAARDLAQSSAETIWSDIAGPYFSYEKYHFHTNSVGLPMRFFRLIKP